MAPSPPHHRLQDLFFANRTQGPYSYVKEGAKDVFYNDVPETIASAMMEKIVAGKQGFGGMMAPVPFIMADLTIPATYWLCEKDKVVPIHAQEKLVASVPKMRTKRLEAGHSPFLSQPDKAVDIIVKVASE